MNPRLRNALGALDRAHSAILVAEDGRAFAALEGACRELAAVVQEQDERLAKVEALLEMGADETDGGAP